MTSQPHILGIGGTTRPDSSTEKALRVALASAEAAGATTTAFLGADLAALPMYAPEDPERTIAAKRFVAEVTRADGLIIASPAYHGGVSGMVKNALDYVEDLRDGERPYFDGRAVGCIATGAGWQGIVVTLESLRTITHALRGWPTPLGAAVNSLDKPFGPDGVVVDPKVDFQLRTVGQEVVAFARAQAAAAAALVTA